jgi:hypothetical protein
MLRPGTLGALPRGSRPAVAAVRGCTLDRAAPLVSGRAQRSACCGSATWRRSAGCFHWQHHQPPAGFSTPLRHPALLSGLGRGSRALASGPHVPKQVSEPGDSSGSDGDDDDDDKPGVGSADAPDNKMDPALMKHVAILTGSQLMLNLGFSQVVPVLPLFAQEMGGHLGATGVGMIIAAPSVARLLCNVRRRQLAPAAGRHLLCAACCLRV